MIPVETAEPGRTLADPATIQAYLEELAATGAGVRLAVPGHPPVPAVVGVLDAAAGRFRARLGRPLPVTWIRRHEIDLLFALDGVRLAAPVRFLERDGYLEASFSLPRLVRLGDRRQGLRAHFSPREKASVTALEGLVGARGVTGRLLDLSMEGLRMRLERAVAHGGRAALEPGLDLFPVGTRFPVLRLDQLPYSPVVVCAGVVVNAAQDRGGVALGIRFDPLGDLEAQILRQVLARRLPRFRQGFPERRRDKGAAPGVEVNVVHDGPRGKAPESPGDPVRAGKRLLVAIGDDLDRAIVVAGLQRLGYRRLHEARNPAEAVDQLRLFSMDALVLADPLGAAPATEFLVRLRRHGLARTVPALLLARKVDVRLRVEAKAAEIEHVVPLGDGCAAEVDDLLRGPFGLA